MIYLCLLLIFKMYLILASLACIVALSVSRLYGSILNNRNFAPWVKKGLACVFRRLRLLSADTAHGQESESLGASSGLHCMLEQGSCKSQPPTATQPAPESAAGVVEGEHGEDQQRRSFRKVAAAGCQRKGCQPGPCTNRSSNATATERCRVAQHCEGRQSTGQSNAQGATQTPPTTQGERRPMAIMQTDMSATKNSTRAVPSVRSFIFLARRQDCCWTEEVQSQGGQMRECRKYSTSTQVAKEA